MGSEDHDRERVRDIVERLTAEDILTSIISSVWCKTGRHPGELADLMKEAAEEITRLRAENETLRRDVRTAVMGDSAELQDVKRENEKLREALSALAKHCNEMEAQNHDYHTMGEGGAPCISEPLANAYNILRAAAAAIRESGDE